jgi:hypothetical protein
MLCSKLQYLPFVHIKNLRHLADRGVSFTRFILRIFRPLMLDRLDFQYRPNLHCAKPTNEQEKEDLRGCCSRILRSVSGPYAVFLLFVC